MTQEKKKSIPVQTVFEEWHKDPEYMAEIAALEDEFALADQFIKARGAAGLTQQELADRMKTSQSYIARLEGGRETPSTRTLNRFAEATGHRVVINFEPIGARRV
ncbi:MAG: helix-turn-helix transcriptional regulator [Pseudomonadota bacterium]